MRIAPNCSIIEDKRAGGASQAEIDDIRKQGEEMKEMLENPFINAAVTFTEPFPVGLLITLISAAVLRKKEADAYAYAAIGGQIQIKLRSPYGLSMRPTLGQNLPARTHGSG